MTRFAIAGLAVSCAVLFYCAVGSNIIPTAERHDYLCVYAGAALAHAGDFAHIHDPERIFAFERTIFPDLPRVVPFERPAIYAAVLAPMAAIPFRIAFWTWIGAQAALLAMCWGWAAWKFGPSGLIWSALFLPTAYGIANGQDCVVLLALMIAAYECAERGWLGVSGFAIGLTVFKFHLLLLFPVLMLVSRRFRMLAGYAAGGAVIFLVSLALDGWGGLMRHYELLRRKDIAELSPSPEMMANIHAIPANLGIDATAVSIALAAAVAAIAIYAAWNAPLWRWFAAAVAGSLVMIPHVYNYDVAVMLAPVLLAIFRAETKTLKVAAMTLALPCVFWLPAAGPPWAMGPALAMLFFLIAIAREQTRTASASPANAGLLAPATR